MNLCIFLIFHIKHVFICNFYKMSEKKCSLTYTFFSRKVFLNYIYLFLRDWWLLYNIGLISAICQHELASGVHMSPPSWTSLPPPALSHPSRLLQNPSLSSLSHTANFHWLSILYMIVYLLTCCSLHSSYPLLPSFCPCPWVCSLWLCLNYCPVNIFISTIFLDSTYLH